MEAIRALPMFAGFCYTQLADTYQEANGLLFGDRTPKIPLEDIARATRLSPSDREQQQEEEWRARMQRFRVDHGLSHF
jgi:hypothetical protein